VLLCLTISNSTTLTQLQLASNLYCTAQPLASLPSRRWCR